ncbi:hypothetical protein BDD12DRAFT_869109 [Trichophaea hybrida]|nr:hypothetical protein BDD12DRAFT_869109 [Trichophaea hybrida]
MSTSTSTHHLVAHKHVDDSILPYPGQLIKIRLPGALAGPGSVLSKSAVSSATQYNYHSALVTSSSRNVREQYFTVQVYPIPSYSNSSDAALWISQQPSDIQRLHIPLEPADPTTTPTVFGAPLQPTTIINGQRVRYYDRFPSWVLVQPFTFSVPFTKRWKSFSPDVVFSSSEVLRLQEYEASLPISAVVNYCFEPDYSPAAVDLFHMMGQGLGEFADEDEDENKDHDDGGIAEAVEISEGDPACSPAEYFEMLPQLKRSDWMVEEIERSKKEIAAAKEKRTMSWIEQIIYDELD